MGKIRSVLMVCTGNSCRSVMAEALLKKYLKGYGKSDITVRSAGIRALDGHLPTGETIEALKEEGIELKNFKSAAVTGEMVKEADLILAMERIHKYELVRRFPEAASKIFLLREYAGAKESIKVDDPDVPDPIGMPVSEYKACMDMIKNNIERVAGLL